MSAARLMVAMATNNRWANFRLHAVCLRLSQAEFEAPRVGFFPSLRATLNHILVIDRFYVDAMEGGTLGPAAWADEEPCPTMASLAVAQADIDERLIALVQPVTDVGLEAIVHVHRDTRIQHERLDRLLLHLFQHQLHHRGQAHAMLSGTSQAPPQLDEFFSAGEAPLLEAEFDALSFNEAMIWPLPSASEAIEPAPSWSKAGADVLLPSGRPPLVE